MKWYIKAYKYQLRKLYISSLRCLIITHWTCIIPTRINTNYAQACTVGTGFFKWTLVKWWEWLLLKLDPFKLKQHRSGFGTCALSQTCFPAVRGTVVPKSLILAFAAAGSAPLHPCCQGQGVQSEPFIPGDQHSAQGQPVTGPPHGAGWDARSMRGSTFSCCAGSIRDQH